MQTPKKGSKKTLSLKEQVEADKAAARKRFKAYPNSSSNARANKVVGMKTGGTVKSKKK